MTWFAIDTWIVITAALAGVACAIPGSLLVLRRLSMMGDAISHAVLPGIAIGFLASGARTSFLMFFAAALTGLLTAFLTEFIGNRSRFERGAAMGVVFTTLFASGLLLMVSAANHVDLDPSCVLFGSLELTPLDVLYSLQIGNTFIDIPRATVVLGIVCLINLAIVIAAYRAFVMTAFDAGHADSIGVSSRMFHYLLMAVSAVTTVAAFEAVGSILVIAMLIVPAATARLFAQSLSATILYASLFAIASAIIGHASAIYLPPLLGFSDTNSAGMLALTAGVIFALAVAVSAIVRHWRRHSVEQNLSSKTTRTASA